MSVTTFFPKESTSIYNELILSSADKLVYNMLGERVYGTDIHRVTIANLSTAELGDIGKVQELPARLGLLPSTRVVDYEGNIFF